MRWMFTFLFFLLFSYTAGAQKITGIWRGYFSSSAGTYREGVREEMYKYEIQIEQQSNNALKGVTYSYKSTVFYGKAEIQGIVTLPSKSIIIKEIKLLDLKIGDKSEPCLMTCYLDYARMGKLEVLEGTFISVNIKDKGDCGSGKLYLERVAASDFKKEDFLLKKKPTDTPKTKPAETTLTPLASKPSIIRPDVTQPSHKDNAITKTLPLPPSTSTQRKKSQAAVVPKRTAPSNKQQINKPNIARNNLPKKDNSPKIVTKPAERISEPSVNLKKEEPILLPQTETRKISLPKVLVERENKLVRTITTSEENIQIDLYDNGTIDNDTISVYHNNHLVIAGGRLSYTPITVKIKCTKADSRHEFVVVADNLGDIPPNTALMVITAGKTERYEIFLASNEQRNAKVVINYVPKE